MNYQKLNREFFNGELFLYLGRNYSLQIVFANDINKLEVKLFRGKFYVITNTKDKDIIRNTLEKWYREKILSKVEEK